VIGLGPVDLFDGLVEDDDVLEHHVGGVEVVLADLAVEGVAEGLDIGVDAVVGAAVTHVGGLAVGGGGLEGSHHHEQGEGHTALAALRQQHALGEAAVVGLIKGHILSKYMVHREVIK